MSEQTVVYTLPVLPLKSAVLYPYLMMPLSAGRARSIAAVEAALATESKEIAVFTQRDPDQDYPTQEDLHPIGTKAMIRKVNRSGEEHLELMVLGMERIALLKLDDAEPFLKARVTPLPLPEDKGNEVEALQSALVEVAGEALTLAQPNAPQELRGLLAANEDPMRLAFVLASMFSMESEKGQSLLEAPTRLEALRIMHTYLVHELQVLELKNKINTEARSEMTKEQRDYLLRQQMRAIQQELGEKGEQAEAEQLRERLEKADLPEDILKEAKRELDRLTKLPPGAPDYNVIRTYLDYVLELPWKKSTEDALDIARARQVLDEDHFGLKDVKERILEHLGVLKLNPNAKAPILCFVGAPGVGKTSLGQSIARALGRKFERMSLGGLHDEAELRGHRRTYIGALPGRVIQAMRRAGAKNPVLMLDEVDKLGHDFRGDPAHALLEVLDPEQNKSFRDNYLDLPFDLSKVLFVMTANSLDTIPRPLLDRMEVLRLSGYSEEEKLAIAKKYLIPKQIKETGLTAEQCTLPDETVKKIISGYTREAGLRGLERAIGRVARKLALRFAEGASTECAPVTPADLVEMLGPERFNQEEARRVLPPGVSTGLAWTETGGDVLYIEATLLPDGKGLTLTGQLGEVMQESAKAARSYIWSHADDFDLDPRLFKDDGVHVHVPAGAIPKDGPSAGVTMATALTSLYTKLPARSDVAMTGEITLTGLVLPIGGIKEKVLAARRAGIHTVIMPKANQKDLRELPEDVRKEMEFVFAERIEDVLRTAVPGIGERMALAKTHPINHAA